MYTFLIAIIALVVGYLTYGTLVEKVFGVDDSRQTPAYRCQDGVDYVPMAGWRIFLVQFLNIAGLGPIFGAIMGIFFGPAAFLWIVLGSIFAGGVHDYLSGMISVRKDGASLPRIVGDELGVTVRECMNLLSIVLLLLLTTTFLSGPATLLQGLCPLPTLSAVTDIDRLRMIPMAWVLIIFVYYALATVLPVDKVIGRFYPLFGAILLFMGLGIAVVMLGGHSGEMPELWDGLHNRKGADYPLFPMMFVSIACGAISGFHGTQSPLMARCVTSERQGRWVFYGAMIAEGMLALVWAAAAGSFFADPETGLYGIDGLQAFAARHPGENIAALIVSRVSNSWLGAVGGLMAVVGVIAAPITSGDTALRSARLILSERLGLSQRPKLNRLVIAVPMWTAIAVLVTVDFEVVWRYFAWTNQTLACVTLIACALWLRRHSPYRWAWLMAAIPAAFMVAVCLTYILIAPEGLHLKLW